MAVPKKINCIQASTRIQKGGITMEITGAELFVKALQEVSVNMQLRYGKEKIWQKQSKRLFILQRQESRGW